VQNAFLRLEIAELLAIKAAISGHPLLFADIAGRNARGQISSALKLISYSIINL
jgi:hypothetical protein